MADDKIVQIQEKLEEGKFINIRWGEGELLHIERPLPFLVVYRYPPGEVDPVIKRMVSNEASHFIASEDNEEIFEIIKCLTSSLSAKFGAFLLVEVWPDKKLGQPEIPFFKIYGPADKLPASVEKLEQELKKFSFLVVKPHVDINASKIRSKKGLQPLLTEAEWKKMECLYLGISINPFYLNPNTNGIYPMLVRKFLVGISKVFKQTFFDFVKIQTTQTVENYHALGRSHLNKSVWEVDQKLVNISDQINFLMLITPVNSDEEWEEFKNNKFEKEPNFHYRLLPVDPDQLKRQLYNIPIEKIEDPTMNFLFRDKRFEIEKMLTMLSSRDTPGFLYNSLLLFGGVDDDLLKVAEAILATVKEPEGKNTNWVSAEEFAEVAREEINYFKQQLPEIEAKVEINPNVIGLMVSQGVLYIGENATIAEDRVEALIQHEVGTHVLTYFNGKAQPLKQLYSGVPGYEELQEGLAVLSEYLVGGLNAARLRKLAARVVAINAMIKKEPFIHTFKMLIEKYNFAAYAAFNVTMRAYRGGGLTKDAVYLKGLIDLLKYLKKGKPLDPLYVGKITEAYLPIVQELQFRNILKPIPLKPRYLSNEVAKEKIKTLQKGVTVFNLI